MSDERDPTGSAADPATGAADDDATTSNRGQTAVAARPLRPTGKRARRAVVDGESDTVEADVDTTKDGGGKNGKAKTAKGGDRSRNPFRFVLTYLQQVIAELRKVIWPNRKQMGTYTTVVLVFLAFMVALIAGADYGLAWVISWAFGN
ncbi:preprotein translocase subunit SecE [Mycolicibacterium thermoresistibile]